MIYNISKAFIYEIWNKIPVICKNPKGTSIGTLLQVAKHSYRPR
jgi:hypothetical protein